MENKDLIIKENNSKFYFWSLFLLSLVLSFAMGSVLLLLILKYLNKVTIFNTFLILMYIYFFQLVLEVLKNLMCHFTKLNSEFKFSKILNNKFLIVNFLMFILIGTFIFIFSILSSFFTVLNILFMSLMILLIGIIYLIYTIEVFNIIDYNNEKSSFDIIKQQSNKVFVLLLINLLFITLIFIAVCLFKYLHSLIFVFITLVNFCLYFMNKWYLNKKN